MYGIKVVIAAALAIRGNGSQIVYFSHSAGTEHSAPPMHPICASSAELALLQATVLSNNFTRVGVQGPGVVHLHIFCMPGKNQHNLQISRI